MIRPADHEYGRIRIFTYYMDSITERRRTLHAIAERLRARHPDGGLDVQMLCLAEEVGEAVQAYRRATGRARRPGSWDAVAEELSDVVIVAQITAELAGIDLDAAIDAKLRVIEMRGGV